ncbi:MAG TPA: phosphate ABC transporter ATP-binding protein [Phycisphaerae bacterium]|nr:phosphate ABC transporter ATP-binding protein [Phycisphaerae bacterium]
MRDEAANGDVARQEARLLGALAPGEAPAAAAKVQAEDFSVALAGAAVLRHITLDIRPQERLAIIGPAASGKTTFLRSLNRLNDLDPQFSKSGHIRIDGRDIYGPDVDVADLRRRVGMVFAVPIPLPWTLYENLAYGPRLAGVTDRARLDGLVESSLRAAFLWDEVKDRLGDLATNLSGGQQQRLCMARVLALEPEVLLLDEPCSGLDPISTARIEEALAELKARYSIVLVTNNTKQAARASDRTAFFLMGELIECGPTEQVFTNPQHGRTNDYITGHFG